MMFGPPTHLMPEIVQFSYLELRELFDEMQQRSQTDVPSKSNVDDELLLLEFDLAELPDEVLADDGGRLYFMIHQNDLTLHFALASDYGYGG